MVSRAAASGGSGGSVAAVSQRPRAADAASADGLRKSPRAGGAFSINKLPPWDKNRRATDTERVHAVFTLGVKNQKFKQDAEEQAREILKYITSVKTTTKSGYMVVGKESYLSDTEALNHIRENDEPFTFFKSWYRTEYNLHTAVTDGEAVTGREDTGIAVTDGEAATGREDNI